MVAMDVHRLSLLQLVVRVTIQHSQNFNTVLLLIGLLIILEQAPTVTDLGSVLRLELCGYVELTQHQGGFVGSQCICGDCNGA